MRHISGLIAQTIWRVPPRKDDGRIEQDWFGYTAGAQRPD